MKSSNAKGFVLIILSVIFLWASCFAQGPWTQKKNTGFFQVQTTLPLGTYDGLILKGTSIADTETNINREVVNIDFGIYALYGITDKITVFSKLPFKYVATKDVTDSLYNPVLLAEGSLVGLSNFHLGVKYGLLDKRIKVAASIQTNWNTASTELSKGLTTGYLSNSFGLYGHVGGSISDRLYSFFDLGYNLATNDYSDYVDVFFELGFKVASARNLWAILNVNIKESMENGSYLNENLLQTGLYVNDQEWAGYGFKLLYETDKHIGFTLGTAGAFSANYVGFVGPINFGVYKKW